MVDALYSAKSHFAPDGLLVDIRPLDTRIPLCVRDEMAVYPAGMIDISHKAAGFRQAEEALEEVVNNGTFKMIDLIVADYSVYFDTIDACRDYLATEWSSATVSDDVWGRMDELLAKSAKPMQIYYTEHVKFCSLK